MQSAARLSAGDEHWELDETEWWILRRHWVDQGSQGQAVARLFNTGGHFGRGEIEHLAALFESLRDAGDLPLIVGVDKYPNHSDWHARWRKLLQDEGVAFESHSRQGLAVFRGKVNLSRAHPATRPDAQKSLPPYGSVVTKCLAAIGRAREVGAFEAVLATTYEGL